LLKQSVPATNNLLPKETTTKPGPIKGPASHDKTNWHWLI